MPTAEERAAKKALIDRGKLLARKQTPYAKVEIWQHGETLGLTIDDGSQVNSTDELAYSAYLTRPALESHGEPRDVLIIGGGDMGPLREVLRYEQVQTATLVEIDEELVKLCKEHLKPIHNDSYKDPRAHLVFADGLSFLRDAPANSMDVIIVDGTDYRFAWGDSKVYGNSLFSVPFYTQSFRVLRPNGMLAQYASNLDVADEISKAGFDSAMPYEILLKSLDEGGARYYLVMKGESYRQDIAKMAIRGLHQQDMGQRLTAKQLEEAQLTPAINQLEQPPHTEL